MYLGYNNRLNTYGILEMDLWVVQGLHDKDRVEVSIHGEWKKAWFRKDDKTCWLESRGEARTLLVQGNEIEGLKVRI